MLVLKIVDAFVKGYYAPHNDKEAYWQDIWAAISNLVQTAGILYFVQNPALGDGLSQVSLQRCMIAIPCSIPMWAIKAQRNNSTGMWSCKTMNRPSHVTFLKFILAAVCGYYGRGDCTSLSWCPGRCNCKRVSSFSLLKNVRFRLTCLCTQRI